MSCFGQTFGRRSLVLMGGEDTETPAPECSAKLQAPKLGGAPVEWHLYPKATHCWDCKEMNGLKKVDVRGNHVTYRYDEVTTRDSRKRMYDFLSTSLSRKK